MAKKKKVQTLHDLEHLKIGSCDYSIQWKPGVYHKRDGGEEMVPCYGQVHYANLIIEMNNQPNPAFAWTVLLHEALHAILYQGYFAQDDEAEQMITYLGHAITALLRDNPDFVAQLNKVYEPEEPSLPPLDKL